MRHGKFKFAETVYTSLGSTRQPLYTLPGVLTIMVALQVIPTDTRGLLGLAVLDTEQMTIDTTWKKLTTRNVLDENGGSVVYIDE